MNDQRSLLDQLRELIELANKNGLYDAGDFLAQYVASVAEKEQPKAKVGDFILLRLLNNEIGKLEVLSVFKKHSTFIYRVKAQNGREADLFEVDPNIVGIERGNNER